MTARLDAPCAHLPDAFARVVRVAPLPLETRTLLLHLGSFDLDARLPPSPGAMPLALRQLLKLALLPDGSVRLARVTTDSAPADVAVHVTRGGTMLRLSRADLERDVRFVAQRLAAGLTEPEELVRLSETFAMELAREETVRTLASRMLRAKDLDEALYAMLLGITSGYGARFHRAALFELDEATATFRGSIAIGPSDEGEAHRIWEAIETEDKTLDQALDDHATRDKVGGFEGFVRTLELPPSAADEVAEALASGAPTIFRARPTNPTLARLLSPATEYVLAVIQPRGTRLGLLVADNAYGGEPIVPAQIEFLRALVEPTSLVWHTRSLLRRVDALARHDPLTGLFNRRELEERLAVEQSRCGRAERPLSLAMIDFDHFKEVNDTRGHVEGDVMLRRVGKLLQETLRQHDVPSRYGGDEFVLMLPEGSKHELVAVLTRIGKRAREEGISLSIGGATWPEDSADASTLLAMADAQLYVAKAAGRGCLSVPGSPPARF
jgi:diguanylate cyclase (GGDEF)-like protein